MYLVFSTKLTTEHVLLSFLHSSFISSSTSRSLQSEPLLPSSPLSASPLSASPDPDPSEVSDESVVSGDVLPSSGVSSEVLLPVPAGTSGSSGADVVIFVPDREVLFDDSFSMHDLFCSF